MDVMKATNKYNKWPPVQPPTPALTPWPACCAAPDPSSQSRACLLCPSSQQSLPGLPPVQPLTPAVTPWPACCVPTTALPLPAAVGGHVFSFSPHILTELLVFQATCSAL